MRENRLSGSEGGGTANPDLPTPIQERLPSVVCRWLQEPQPNHNTPMTIVTKVSGAPTRAYSEKVIFIWCRTGCSTMRFATDPSTVRLPARVEDMASVSQARLGSARWGINGRITNTAGTSLHMPM